jgi:hypothetical protein
MATEENSLSDKKKHLSIALTALALFAAFTSSMPSVQNSVKAFLNKPNRQILAKIIGFYGPEQNEFLILKLKDEYGIQVEIYEKNRETSQQIFKQKFELLQDTDTYITIDRNTTNLALSDIDKDGQLDILVPTVDRNGNSRLNSFRFNADLNSFESIQENSSPLPSPSF